MAEANPSDPGLAPQPATARRIFAALRTTDAAIYGSFALVAAMLQIITWRGVTPYVLLTGDTANIGAMVAGWWNPERFVGDGALGDPRLFHFYFTIHILLVHLLSAVVGDIGTAFHVLLAPHVFAYLVGWYWVGRRVLGSRAWGLVFAATNFVCIPTMTGDYWGLVYDVQPRLTFATLLPYVLVPALRALDRPSLENALFIAAGGLVYAHPVSAPSVGFAFLVAFLVARGPRSSALRLILFATRWSALSLIVAGPFAWIYLGHHEHGRHVAAGEVISVMKEFVGAEYYDVGAALRSYASSRPFALTFLLGLVCLWRTDRLKSGHKVFFASWLAGLFAASVGITAIEQWACRRFGMLPVEIDLIRNMRYAAPICLLLIVEGAREAMDQARRTYGDLAGRAALLAGSAVLAVWMVAFHVAGPFREAAACLRHGALLCPPAQAALRRDVLASLSGLPEREAVFLFSKHDESDLGMAIRYEALRPVAFTERDKNNFAYSSPDRLFSWRSLHDRMASAASSAGTSSWLAAGAELARSTRARYLLAIERVTIAPPGTRLVRTTNSFSILDVSANPDGASAPGIPAL
ncbi:MAG: hypothetical protein ABTD50_06240 [Polyangiaceae bacterium]|jgi:hypothetical protein